MLDYGRDAKFELSVVHRATLAGDLKLRFISKSGFSEFVFTTDTGTEPDTNNFQIDDIPIYLSVVDDAGGFRQGENFIQVFLRINGEVIYELCSGFVYKQKSISFPVSNQNDIIPGRGFFVTRTGTINPAAGNDLSDLVPGNRLWHVLSLWVELVTDSTVTTRTMSVQFSTAGSAEWSATSSITQTASLTRRYMLNIRGAPVTTSYSIVNEVNLPSDIWLPGGSTIATIVNNLQAGDNISNFTIFVEEFLNNSES